MNEVSTQTLHVVARELNTELNDARAALEAFGEHQEDLEQLRKCREYLRQVRGALRVVEVFGAALLVEEMEQLAQYLIDNFSEKRHLAEGLDALMRAMVQLPTYLERVLSGGRDMALVLLPLLNDLRAVRGNPLLSEGTLLLLNLSSDKQANPIAPAPGEPSLSVAHWARRMRTRFQLGLLGWIKGERVDQNLEILARSAEKLEQIATMQPVFQLWWVVGAVLEALRDHGLEGSASVKRLLGQADREMRRLYEQGEAHYCERPPLDLLNNLLFYVGRATNRGPRVAAVRASFRLGELLPLDEQVEAARESLSAPSIKLMKTVAGAIKEDLARVKDALDIFVRKGGSHAEELEPQLELLKKIGDTLGVLGLGELRERVQQQTAGLHGLLKTGSIDDGALLAMASTLINVEDSLDDQLVGLIAPSTAQPAADPADATANDMEFRQVTEAVLRECIVNMARIKEIIALAIEKPHERQALEQVPPLVHGITAGLLMLGKSRAVEITERIGKALARHATPNGAPIQSEGMDRLADAIVAVEYYMETIQAGRSDPWYMLDNSENCLKALSELNSGTGISRIPDLTGRHAAPAAPSAHTEIERTEVISRPAPAPVDLNATETNLPPVLVLPSDKSDPEFLELFIEEARDELAKLQQLLARWDENPQDNEALANVRRSFHTLKGSGRLVGAQLIGEFAWSMENVLNRVINKTLERTPEIMALLKQAVNELPELVEQLEVGTPTRPAIGSLIAQAHAIAGARDAAARAAPRPKQPEPASQSGAYAVTVVAPTPPSAPAAPQIDLVLNEIFAKEARGHLEAIRDYISACRVSAPPYPVTEALHRACHTLSGTTKTAGARQGIKIAEPLNHYIRKLYDNGASLPAEGLQILQESVAAVENIIANISENTAFFSSQISLIERLEELEQRLDSELSSIGAPNEATSITQIQDLPEFLEAADQVTQPESSAPEQAAVTSSDNTAAHTEEPPPAFSEAEFVLRDWEQSAEESIEHIELAAPQEPELIVETTDWAQHYVSPVLDFEATDTHELVSTPAEEPIAEPQPTQAEFVARFSTELPAPTPIATGVERTVDEDEEADDEFDPDIAAIFTEEASELLEASETAFSHWRADRNNAAHAYELKRALHTLKGGARMAGIRAMGDLSHELESLMQAMEHGLIPSNQAVFDVVQVSLDELHRMHEVLGQGQRVTPARELISKVRALGYGQTLEAELPEPPAPTIPPPLVSEAQFKPQPVVVEPTLELDAEFSAEELGPVSAETPAVPPIEIVSAAEPAAEPASAAPPSLTPLTPALPPGREPQVQERGEMARVDAELLDNLLNNAGEVSIFRSRLEQQVTSLDFNLSELDRVVTRLKEQLRNMEMETEAQILHKFQDENKGREDFDPLELDRYSTIQQLSRALAESVSDVASIQGLLQNLAREGQNLLLQQSRVVTELQNGLMRTRMVPFSRHVQRLTRLVRQVAADTGKHAELVVTGASGELDRQVLDRMLPPFEHMMRNAVVHGIESPEDRHATGKAEIGTIKVGLHREGAEMVIVIEDDGRGIDVKAVREHAATRGLIQPGRPLSDEEALQLILEPGFSTANNVTQHAGRGVGMDVVVTEVKRLGGTLLTESTPGHGTRFIVRLPFTLAISQALIVRVGDEEMYALPLPTVEGVVRLPSEQVMRHLSEDEPTFNYGGQVYRFQHLGAFIGGGPSVIPENQVSVPLVLIKAGEHSTALVTDELIGNREIVVKSVGPQIAGIRGIAGATILGDGRVVIILDMAALVRSEWRTRPAAELVRGEDRRTLVLVVDDSITVRRVTQRLLERNGMRVMTAKDGIDALSILQEHVPDVILLDIEMPRMDGYELAAQVRSDSRLAAVPIIMITSRVGEKHRARAIEIGVNDYLGKPYQEHQLLDAIEALVDAHKRAAVSG